MLKQGKINELLKSDTDIAVMYILTPGGVKSDCAGPPSLASAYKTMEHVSSSKRERHTYTHTYTRQSKYNYSIEEDEYDEPNTII